MALVVEVSDRSLDTDRVKARTYARAGVPEYWIVNMPGRCVEVHTGAAANDDGDDTCRVLREGDLLRLAVDGEERGVVPVASLLPT